MPSCVVKWCRSHTDMRSYCQISFHEFPRKEVMRKKWIAAVRLERNESDWMPTERSKICSIHFKSDNIYIPNNGRKRLKKTAVPICTMVSANADPSSSLPLKDVQEKANHRHIPNCKSVIEKKYGIAGDKSKNPESTVAGVLVNKNMDIPGTSGTRRSSSSTSDEEFSWPYSRNETEDGEKETQDEQSNASDQFIEHHEIEEDGLQDITEVKIEPPDELDLDAVKTEPEDMNSILGSDGGASEGFSPFVRATSVNLPTINMFAVLEFITKNNYYTTLDYEKLKNVTSPPNDTKLLSGLRVQNCEFIHRVRCTVHLQTTSQCGIEYDTNTYTVTRSECMCACATCEHVAALLMWLHCVSNQKKYNPKLVPDDTSTSKNTTAKTWDSKTVTVTRDSAKIPVMPRTDYSEVSLSEADDPLNVPEVPGPSTAKRKKMAPTTPGSYTTQVFKTKSTPKDTDTKIDESIIKCSFTRKCFFNVWRSTKGNFNEKLRHTRSIMTKAFHDANYVIDFLPLEKRLEELCMEIEGYWNVDANREGFETKFADWFAAVENIDMKKTRREVVPGSSTSYGGVL